MRIAFTVSVKQSGRVELLNLKFQRDQIIHHEMTPNKLELKAYIISRICLVVGGPGIASRSS